MGRKGTEKASAGERLEGFDAEWYRSKYPDVDMLRMDPAEHYARYGQRLGRSGNAHGRQSQASASSMPSAAAAPGQAEGSPDIREFCEQEWANYSRRKHVIDMLSRKDLPLVSVVMTSHNAEETVEAAVESVLMQSYPNLEVIVCDDASSDRTWSILQALQARTGGALRTIRLARNSGTYLAKNVAIEAARGDYILFQDSDDYSHPYRVASQVEPLLDDVTLIVTRTKYARYNPETFKVIPREGHAAKLGLITLCVKRRVFAEIGFFDAVRKAGDDEWFRRLRHLYGDHSVRDLSVSLYNAELREDSLIADMVKVMPDGSIGQSSSASRRAYVRAFNKRLEDKSLGRAWYQANFPPYPTRAQQAYPEGVAALSPERPPVIGAVCSIPSRLDVFRSVIERILPQVDKLYVYLDKYKDIPDFLKNEKISVSLSHEYDIDLRDNAKFLHFDACKKQNPQGFYYFTFDDDIVYPYDYVRHLIHSIEEYDRVAVVGVHGVLLVEDPERYSRQRVVYHFSADDLHNPVLVNNLGTGTVAFWSDAFPSIDPMQWSAGGMVDIDFSIVARSNSVPFVCVSRHAGWLVAGELPEDDVPLFHENKKKEAVIKSKLDAFRPWGYAGIHQVIGRQESDAAGKLQALLPRFVDGLAVQQFFERMRRKGAS